MRELARRYRIERFGWLVSILTIIPVLIIPALEWLPWIREGWRPWIIILALLLAGAGFLLSRAIELSNETLQQRLAKLQAEKEELEQLLMEARRNLAKGGPEGLLREVATALFRRGAWRLALYRKTYDSRDEKRLTLVACAASDAHLVESNPQELPVRGGTAFSRVFLSNLADPQMRYPDQSGACPEEAGEEEWRLWRGEVIGDVADVSNRDVFPARKMAWYAMQEPSSQNTLVVLAESAEAEGIAFDVLEHRLTSAWMLSAWQMAELRSRAQRMQRQGIG